MIRSLQSLRFFAALIVVIYHASRQFDIVIDDGGFIDKLLKVRLAFGVDLFFVISGFVLCRSVVKNHKSIREFSVDRIKRIVPLYWFYTAVFCVFIFHYPYLSTYSSLDIKSISSSLFFIPIENHAGNYLPVYGVGWSLNYEMYFYAILAISIALTKNHVVLCTAIIISIIYACANIFDVLPYYQSGVVFEFVGGMAIALMGLNRKGSRITIILLLAAILGAYVALNYGTEPRRAILWGIPAILIVAFLVSADRMFNVSDKLVTLGNASYSLYLCHRLVILPIFVVTADSGIKPIYLVLSSVIVSIFLSVISYKYIEPTLSSAWEATGGLITRKSKPLNIKQ